MAATPSPISTPASHGFLRAHAHSAVMLKAVARANPKATMLKNITTSATMGSPSRSLAWVYVLARAIAVY
ncbi:Uncharacterised protein [Mycobacteroides abscessus subsp. massiliense]|nr:Uncharacterised protein [Mycobacteroides abscessus subsp. massiliense]